MIFTYIGWYCYQATVGWDGTFFFDVTPDDTDQTAIGAIHRITVAAVVSRENGERVKCKL